MSTEWSEATDRNCDPKVSGKNGFLNKIVIFYPFIKSQIKRF